MLERRYFFFVLLFLTFIVSIPNSLLGVFAHVTDLEVGVTTPTLAERQFVQANNFKEALNTTDYAFVVNQNLLLSKHFTLGIHWAYLKNGFFIRNANEQQEVVSWDVTHFPLGVLLAYYVSPYHKSEDNWGLLLSSGVLWEQIEEKKSVKTSNSTALSIINRLNTLYYVQSGIRYLIKTTNYSKLNVSLNAYTTLPRLDFYLTVSIGLSIEIYYVK